MMVAKKYTDKNGDTKTQWVKIGSMIDNGVGDDGKRKLFGNVDATPNFDWDGSFNLFEQEEQQGSATGQNYKAPAQQQQQQAQSYQKPQVQQEFINQMNQIVDAQGNPILDNNGQIRYGQPQQQ